MSWQDLPPCDGCFVGCEPRHAHTGRPYPCPEPLRRWALEHRDDYGFVYEDESEDDTWGSTTGPAWPS